MQTNTPTDAPVKLYKLCAPDTPPSVDSGVEFPWDDAQTDWCTGMIVTAVDEQDARNTAALNAQDEGPLVWKNLDHTVCLRLGLASPGIERGQVMLQHIL